MWLRKSVSILHVWCLFWKYSSGAWSSAVSCCSGRFSPGGGTSVIWLTAACPLGGCSVVQQVQTVKLHLWGHNMIPNTQLHTHTLSVMETFTQLTCKASLRVLPYSLYRQTKGSWLSHRLPWTITSLFKRSHPSIIRAAFSLPDVWVT